VGVHDNYYRIHELSNKQLLLDFMTVCDIYLSSSWCRIDRTLHDLSIKRYVVLYNDSMVKTCSL